MRGGALPSEMMAFTMAILPWKIGIQLGKRGIIRVCDGWFDYPFDYLFEATTAVTEGSVSIHLFLLTGEAWLNPTAGM